MKISATIITLNEENNLRRCLESLQGIVDEIIVVDSFSTDKTKEIALQYGVRFLSQSFLGYVGQKNFAASMAENDYVLNIDADEVLSPQMQQSLLALKQESNPATAYSFNRLNNYYGTWMRYGGLYPDRKIRLYDKTKAQFTGLLVHEKVTLNSYGEVIHLNGNILHYAYNSKDALKTQLNKFANLRAEERKQKGCKPSKPKAVLKAFWKFFRDFILFAGFLHGRKGLEISLLYANYEYKKYATIP